MKKREKITIGVVFSLVVVVTLLFVFTDQKSKDITKDIENARFRIIKVIDTPGTSPVYLAVYNDCVGGCKSECGFENLEPCYFFTYDLKTKKPYVITSYYSQEDALYQTLIKFKDRNTIQFMTRKNLSTSYELGSDSHYIWYTKELNLQTGGISVVDTEESYIEYESSP